MRTYMYKGKTVNARQIIEDPRENKLKIPAANVYSRLSHGQTLEHALSYPVKKQPRGYVKKTVPNNFKGCPPELTELMQTDYNINEFLRLAEKIQSGPDWEKSRTFKKRLQKTKPETRAKMRAAKRKT